MRNRIKKISKNKSKIGLSNSSERSYLSELIKDFPCKKRIPLSRAEKLLISRYRQLEKNIPKMLVLLDDHDFANKLSKQFSVYPLGDDLHPKQFYFFNFIFHKYLFDQIISNSGVIRKSTDPNEGRIGFGGSDSRIIAKFKYAGSPCNEIQTHLLECFSLLTKNPTDPISSSVEFYRRFVKIHPFYDANGRIGRLILSIYNRYHGYYIRWSEIESGSNKALFIKKLNECHKRENQYVYSQHFEYLLSFFKKFIIPVSELLR